MKRELPVQGGFDKRALRADALARRAAVPPEAAAAFAERLARRGPELARAHGAAAVAAFWSVGDEVPTRPLLAALDAAGFRIGLPVTGPRRAPLAFRRWTPGTPMAAGRMNIAEPPPTAEEVRPDLLFVPLLAFDRRGHRLGYGAGYYDATLAGLRRAGEVVAIGVAYAAQEVLFVPDEAHDAPLDFVLTEKDLIVPVGAG